MQTGDQWRFTLGKSTVTALLSTIYDILQLLQSGADVTLVFFDLHKAFASVPHWPLLQMLSDCGLNWHVLPWISCYLQGRKKYVVVDSTSSESIPVILGVPQGSVLGPLLCLVYINHVSSLPKTNGSKLTKYAEDILLFKPTNSLEDYEDLQEDIDAISECISTCYLPINPSKCKYLIASRKRHPYLPPRDLTWV